MHAARPSPRNRPSRPVGGARRPPRVLAALLVVASAFLATAPAARAGDAPLPPGVVGRVHGEDITEQQLLDRLARRFETGEKGKEVLEQIVDDLVVAQEARKRGVAVTEEEIAAYTTRLERVVRDQSGGTKTLDDVLGETKTSRDEFRRTTKEFLLRQKMARADLGGKPDEDLPEHRLKLWLATVKRKAVVRFKDLPDGQLAIAGDEVVDRQRFARELKSRLPKETVAGVLVELVLDAATRHAVAKAGVQVTDADIEAQLARVRKRFESNANVQASGITFDAFLRQTFGFGEAELRKDPTFRSRVGLEQMLGKDITDESIRKHWEENRDAYGERALVRQVFVPAGDPTQFQGKSKVLTFQQAGELALRAKVAILDRSGSLKPDAEGGKKAPLPDIVSAVAKDFETDPEKRSSAGEPVAWTRQGVSANPALEQLVFAGALGTVLGPIRCEDGYRVLVVEERRPAPSFEECRAVVRDDLMRVAVRRFQMQLRMDESVILAKE